MDNKRSGQARYPSELKERSVRMGQDLREQNPNDRGVITRVARQFGVGSESPRNWVKQSDIDAERHGRIGHGHLQDRAASQPGSLGRQRRPLEGPRRSAHRFRGSTGSASTPSSGIARRSRSRLSIVISTKPKWPERSKRKSLRETQAGSLLNPLKGKSLQESRGASLLKYEARRTLNSEGEILKHRSPAGALLHALTGRKHSLSESPRL
jgi:transposase-like protein